MSAEIWYLDFNAFRSPEHYSVNNKNREASHATYVILSQVTILIISTKVYTQAPSIHYYVPNVQN